MVACVFINCDIANLACNLFKNCPFGPMNKTVGHPWHTSFDYSGTTASQQWEYEKCQMSTINISTDNVINGFKFTPLPVPQSWPSDSGTAGITKEFHFASLPIPQPPPRNCSTANMTIKFQFTPLPIPHPLPTKTIHNDVIASVHKLSSWISACLAYLLLWTHCPRNNQPDLTDQWHVDIAENSIRSPLYTVLRIS